MEMDSGPKLFTYAVLPNTEAVVLGWDHRWRLGYFRRTNRTKLIHLTWPTVLQALLVTHDQLHDLHKKSRLLLQQEANWSIPFEKVVKFALWQHTNVPFFLTAQNGCN